jgi:hypothetical protein
MSQSAISEIEMLSKLRGSSAVDFGGHIKLTLGSGRSAMGMRIGGEKSEILGVVTLRH